MSEWTGRVMLESTLLHELVHYGLQLNNAKSYDWIDGKEVGKAFEEEVYGVDVNVSNVFDLYNDIYGN